MANFAYLPRSLVLGVLFTFSSAPAPGSWPKSWRSIRSAQASADGYTFSEPEGWGHELAGDVLLLSGDKWRVVLLVRSVARGLATPVRALSRGQRGTLIPAEASMQSKLTRNAFGQPVQRYSLLGRYSTMLGKDDDWAWYVIFSKGYLTIIEAHFKGLHGERLGKVESEAAFVALHLKRNTPSFAGAGRATPWGH